MTQAAIIHSCTKHHVMYFGQNSMCLPPSSSRVQNHSPLSLMKSIYTQDHKCALDLSFIPTLWQTYLCALWSERGLSWPVPPASSSLLVRLLASAELTCGDWPGSTPWPWPWWWSRVGDVTSEGSAGDWFTAVNTCRLYKWSAYTKTCYISVKY